MPTLLRRRYYRKLSSIGKTEKLLGLFLLLLVGGIVVAYYRQAAGNREYLFNVDQAALLGNTEPREQAIARQMLPAIGEGVAGQRSFSPYSPAASATGKELAEAEAIPPGEFSAKLGDTAAELLAFDAQWVYRRRYSTGESPAGELTIIVCDVTSPAQAFGLWQARRPRPNRNGEAAAGALEIGRGGWLADDGLSVGFWNGRYYTELRASDDLSNGGATLAEAAAVIASLQLSYGGPFPQESMLPPEGRVPQSLRYLHRSAFGLEPLREVFLVDLAGGVTAWVLDAKTVSGAGRVVEDLRAAGSSAPVLSSTPENEDRDDWSDQTSYGSPPSGDATAARREGPLTLISLGGHELACFAAGRYVCGAYGVDAGGVVATAMSSHAMAVGQPDGVAAMQASAEPGRPGGGAVTFTSPSSSGDGRSETSPFPEPAESGWRRPRKAHRFTPDNLYEKINGRAAAFLQFHFRGLTFGTYFHQSDPNRTIDVYWYDMGESLNAFGIYRAEAPHDPTPVSLGRQGYQTSGAVFFCKGTDYVQVLPAGEDEADAEVALEVARRIAQRIEGGEEEMWASTVFPEVGRVPDSLQYNASDVFGLDFLEDIFTADYDTDGGRLTLFIHRAQSKESAKGLLDRYVAFFERYGRLSWSDPDATRWIVEGNVAEMIDVVFAKGRYLGGVAGAEDSTAARKAAAGFYGLLDGS